MVPFGEEVKLFRLATSSHPVNKDPLISHYTWDLTADALVQWRTIPVIKVAP